MYQRLALRIFLTGIVMVSSISGQARYDCSLFGIRQSDDLTLSPFISWAAIDQTAASTKLGFIDQESKYIVPDWSKFWYPHFPKYYKQQAIYDAKRFKTTAESMEFVRSKLQNAVKTTSLKGDTLSFVILSSGRVTRITLKGKHQTDAAILQSMKTCLEMLSGQWTPAMARVGELPSEFVDLTAEDENTLIEVNSQQRIIW